MALQSTTAIATVTLQADAFSVTFSSIPQGYRDLIVTVNGNVVSGQGISRLQINSDSGSNYRYVNMTGDGSSATGFASTEGNIYYMLGTAGLSGVVTIFDYSVTDKHKTVLARGDAVGTQTHATAGRWANTSAVTSLFMFTSSGVYTPGTTFSLYGRIA
jgi:hypothetical protein